MNIRNVVVFGFLWLGFFTNVFSAEFNESKDVEMKYKVVDKAFADGQLVLVTKSGARYRFCVSKFLTANYSETFAELFLNNKNVEEHVIEGIDDEVVPSFIAILYILHHQVLLPSYVTIDEQELQDYLKDWKFTKIPKEILEKIDPLKTYLLSIILSENNRVTAELANHCLDTSTDEVKARFLELLFWFAFSSYQK